MSSPHRDARESDQLLPKKPTATDSSLDRGDQDVVDIERGSIHSARDSFELVPKPSEWLGRSSDGERLPYNDYTTIDWANELVKDSDRVRELLHKPGWRGRLFRLLDGVSGWLAAAVIGAITACVAFLVDIAVATLADWKTGYCSENYFATKEACCRIDSTLNQAVAKTTFFTYSTSTYQRLESGEIESTCENWVPWSRQYSSAFAIYVALAVLFGVVSCSVTMLSKRNLPATLADETPNNTDLPQSGRQATVPSPAKGKVMYMAAGSGIPEIKTVLSGFVIPNLLDARVLIIKAVGSVFAVATGMCLGKEGPFVHISTCVAYLVARAIPKYRDNERKLREMLSAGCASGLSVAFGAPIGGVLFSYEEISTYFPRKVLWKAFLCSLCAAITLRQLNPTGTGKLVLFETNYRTSYRPVHYAVFVLLGVAGGIFGGVFCKCNFLWSRKFRQLPWIKTYPVLEVAIIVFVTAVSQYPHPITREPGDIIIKNLLVDCRVESSATAWVCMGERDDASNAYFGWLIYGTAVKLVLTIITFGVKVPSGVIIPALDAGAFFGRLVGQAFASQVSPGIFAMVGAVTFLAGVSRMTISLAVIMLELTGELEYVVPYMVGILVAKWVADAMEPEGVYDLAQSVLGHPFLDGDHALRIAQRSGALIEDLIPPESTMREITIEVNRAGCVPEQVMIEKLNLLRRRGLMDAGLVLVRDGLLFGYLNQAELEVGIQQSSGKMNRLTDGGQSRSVHRGSLAPSEVRLLGARDVTNGEINLAGFVDNTPVAVTIGTPIEVVVELFSKLGVRYVCVQDHGTNRVRGVIIKKRLLDWLHKAKDARY